MSFGSDLSAHDVYVPRYRLLLLYIPKFSVNYYDKIMTRQIIDFSFLYLSLSHRNNPFYFAKRKGLYKTYTIQFSMNHILSIMERNVQHQ